MAPTARKISIFSFDCLSDITQINLYPLIIATSANPIPVFPEVPSIIVPPGFNLPSASASSIIFTAILSFTEFPGLKVSTFANTNASISATILLSFTKGVLPIVSKIFFEKSILCLFNMWF
ncbi:hypothetical protein D3C87_1731230 [compost metagenome]